MTAKSPVVDKLILKFVPAPGVKVIDPIPVKALVAPVRLIFVSATERLEVLSSSDAVLATLMTLSDLS